MWDCWCVVWLWVGCGWGWPVRCSTTVLSRRLLSSHVAEGSNGSHSRSFVISPISRVSATLSRNESNESRGAARCQCHRCSGRVCFRSVCRAAGAAPAKREAAVNPGMSKGLSAASFVSEAYSPDPTTTTRTRATTAACQQRHSTELRGSSHTTVCPQRRAVPAVEA